MKKIYAIYDNVAQETLNIFMANNDSSALRSFNQSIPQNVNKDDFRLFCIADIDLNIPLVRAFDSYLVKEEDTDMSVPDNPAPVVSADVKPMSQEDIVKSVLAQLNGGKN